jgi:acyl-CoA synthetase (AMP-forming)/AMP-acid ligase II
LQYHQLEQKYINGDKDRMVGVLPFFHIFGLTLLMHVALYLGIPVHVMPKFDLVQFCETVQKEKITFTCLVPPIILLLAKHPLIDQYDLTSLDIVICGAAPLGGDLSQQVKKRLPTMVVKQGYGLTETSPCAVVEPTDRVIDGKGIYTTYLPKTNTYLVPGSIGILLPNMTAKIVNEEGRGKNH